MLWTLAAGALLLGFLKVGFGQGAGFVALPLYTLWMPVRPANGIVAPLLCITDLLSIRAYWRRWDTAMFVRFLPGQLSGILLGSYALAHLSESRARRVIGTIMIALALIQLWSLRSRPEGEPRPARLLPAILFSLAAGFTSALAQTGSAITSLYMIRLQTPKESFVPTLNLTFFFSNAVKVAGYWHYGLLDSAILRSDIWLSPLALAGGLIGLAANRRIPQRTFEYVVLTFVLAAGVKLLTL